MKAITLYEPWATLVATGRKKIETRSWYTSYRGVLAIHASLNKKHINMRSGYYVCDKEPFYSALMAIRPTWHLGHIIAYTEITDCFHINAFGYKPEEPELSFGDFSHGRYMWILHNTIKLLTPIQARGAMGLWEWNGRPECGKSGESSFTRS